MKVGVVKEFRDEYFFLSNFFMAPFKWRNRIYPSGEHAFSAAKYLSAIDSDFPSTVKYVENVLKAKTPKQAKALGRSLKIDVPDWNNRRVYIMREIVHAKFANNESQYDMVGMLINTGAMMLVEGNTWGDEFWGRCNGKGFNTLGALLMEERGYWLKGDFND